MPRKATKDPREEEEQDSKDLTPAKHAKLFLDANKKEHWNPTKGGEYNPENYRISTGSLKLDIITGGGVRPGIIRLHGENSGGKSSEALELMRNFFLKQPDGYGFYNDAEGRLSDEHKLRCGIKFVYKAEDWVPGTCFVYLSNIYESVVAYVLSLVQNNPKKIKYFFVVDSVDALMLRDDLEKKPEESYKVAGAAVISKKLMQRVTHPIHLLGHFFVFTTQVTASVPKTGDKTPPPKISGPNNLKHYCDHIWEFTPRYTKHQILKNPNVKEFDSIKNPIIGHLVPLIIRKSPNEKNEVRMDYPVCYGRKGGSSVWVEREITDTLLAYGFLDIRGSWLYFKQELLDEVKAIDANVPDKVQGSEKLYQYISDNENVRDFLFVKLTDMLTATVIWEGDGDPLEDDDETEEPKEGE